MAQDRGMKSWKEWKKHFSSSVKCIELKKENENKEPSAAAASPVTEEKKIRE